MNDAVMSALIEAYLGVHEGDLRKAHAEAHKGAFDVQAYDQWTRSRVIWQIAHDDNRTRLETYLLWNGIIGFTSTIFAIATEDMS